MEIRHCDDAGVRVIEMEGRLDELSATDAERRLLELVDCEGCRAVLDLSRVEYVSSGGLRVIMSTMKTLRKRGGDLRSCGLNPFVAEVFEISGLRSIMKVYKGLDEARADWAVGGNQ